MGYKYLYLIESGNHNYIVSAKNSVEAVELWINAKNDEREKDKLSRSFMPHNYSIRELEREDLVIRVAE